MHRLVARGAKRNAVIYIESMVWILRIRQDVVGMKGALRAMAARLARVVIAASHGSCPQAQVGAVAVTLSRRATLPIVMILASDRWLRLATMCCRDSRNPFRCFRLALPHLRQQGASLGAWLAAFAITGPDGFRGFGDDLAALAFRDRAAACFAVRGQLPTAQRGGNLGDDFWWSLASTQGRCDGGFRGVGMLSRQRFILSLTEAR